MFAAKIDNNAKKWQISYRQIIRKIFFLTKISIENHWKASKHFNNAPKTSFFAEQCAKIRKKWLIFTEKLP